MKVKNSRLTGTLVAGLTGALVVSSLVGASASSHREAPLITEDPVADNTDTYAFVAPNDPDTDFDESEYTTLIANWIPLEEPASGPNFHKFGDDVLYSIKVDSDGDAVEDVTYEWRFRTQDNTGTAIEGGEFLYNDGPITLDDDDTAGPYSASWKLPQTYTLTRVADGEREVIAEDLYTPPVNVGVRSTPDYPALANAAKYAINSDGVPQPLEDVVGDGPEYVSFAGPRDEVFNLDLGSIFDLGGLRPLNEAHLIEQPTQEGVDTTAGYNVHTIALQVPTEEVTRDGNGVIGVWSSTSRKKARVFTGNSGAELQHAGPWVQVSRLGMPLVNELVVPYSLKDAFNSIEPSQDATVADGALAAEVMNPGLDNLVATLYGDSGAFSCYPDVDAARPDIFAIFLTGLEGANQLETVTPSEMLRLNTGVEPTSFDDANTGGFLAGDMAGFPNGRRPLDDTVDSALQVVAGAAGECAGESPNNALGDGVPTGRDNDLGLEESFPYLPDPHSGYLSDNERGTNQDTDPDFPPNEGEGA